DDPLERSSETRVRWSVEGFFEWGRLVMSRNGRRFGEVSRLPRVIAIFPDAL
ncbi:MAG: hypothetical protein RL245_630, partial [Pseudomonadota bacterium]